MKVGRKTTVDTLYDLSPFLLMTRVDEINYIVSIEGDKYVTVYKNPTQDTLTVLRKNETHLPVWFNVTCSIDLLDMGMRDLHTFLGTLIRGRY